MNHDDIWRDILDVIRCQSAEALRHIACPVCGGNVSIAYTVVGKNKVAGLGVTCQNMQCLANVRTSGVAVEPPWVAEAGSRIVTEPI